MYCLTYLKTNIATYYKDVDVLKLRPVEICNTYNFAREHIAIPIDGELVGAYLLNHRWDFYGKRYLPLQIVVFIVDNGVPNVNKFEIEYV